MDLRWAILKNSDFTDSDMQSIGLLEANVSGSILARVNLSDGDLRRTNLSGASLVGANLSRSNLAMADLTGAAIEGVSFDTCNTYGTKF